MNEGPDIWFIGSATIGDQPIFGQTDFRCNAGQWTCLLGPSGVGKSTVLKLLAGLETAVIFEGEVGSSDGRALSGRTAYMAQNDLLMPWLDVLGNVCLGSRLRGDMPDLDLAIQLIDRVGLADHAGKRPAELSGGMRQRVALARTLMEDQPVVLLDEAFSALDARTRAEMQELSASLLHGRTVLLVTHDPAEAARLGQKIVLMDRDGLEEMVAPASKPVRAYDDPDVFACQSALMARVRAAA